MKKTLSWWILLLISIFSYGISYLFGGVIGNVIGILGLLTLLFSIIAGIRELRSNQVFKSKLLEYKNYFIFAIVLTIFLILGALVSNKYNKSLVKTQEVNFSTITNQPAMDTATDLLDPSQEQSLRLQAKARGYSTECEEALIQYAKKKSAQEKGLSYQKPQELDSESECSNFREN